MMIRSLDLLWRVERSRRLPAASVAPMPRAAIGRVRTLIDQLRNWFTEI